MEKHKVRVGSRDSRLAIAQSMLVIGQIRRAHPELEVELVTMKTTGDRILDRPLDKIGGKGLFVRELDQALLEGRIDLAVHSLKDLPMETDPRLPLAAFSPRADAGDVLILPQGRQTPDLSLPFGTSSPRRRVQIGRLFAGAQVESVRGNVQTRIEKLDRGGFSALVLAHAGIERLGMQDRISRVFGPEEMIPAAGQGILVTQARAGDDLWYLEEADCRESRIAAAAERSFVRALGGGCTEPIAAYAQVRGGELCLTGLFAVEEAGILRTGGLTGDAGAPEQLGERLAAQLGGV